ncbi:MAG: hypothetical protein BIFFINMI_01648 [Phycisphaerae bacterium]|nr:hypothetical protein [Phycisphaerae bacterium]
MAAKGDWKLRACSEFCGVGPDGAVREVDRSDAHWQAAAGGTVRIATPRNGWASLRLIVEGFGTCRVSADVGDGVAVDMHRAFFHRLKKDGAWHADALVPLPNPATLEVPDADNAVPGQKVALVWVDLWIPRDATPGTHAGTLTLSGGGQTQSIDLAVEVLAASYPDADCIQMDYNSYGSTFLENLYGSQLPASGARRDKAVLDLCHQYHALVYEHRGLYHQLGVGHSGVTHRLFAPTLSGDGRNRHVKDWSLYDYHYGPLCDGSAFDGCRRKSAPVYSIYTPFNVGWPADYLGYGQPGYRVELVNVLKDFDAHFRAKGWTRTVLEFFFNHKKRYRFFEWDGDEPRYARDDATFRLYRGFLDEVAQGSPVRWRFRQDASWMMKEHFRDLLGVVDFWVCGGFVSAWPKEVHAGPMARGDIVWWYNGTPTIDQCAADINQLVYKTWFRDFTGNCIWLTTSTGPDPWFDNNGCATGLIYPGVRFGVPGPIPSIRMKVLRNAVQDVNLLQQAVQAGTDKQAIVAEISAKAPMKLWRPPSEGMATLPPMEWTASNMKVPSEPDQARWSATGPLWWSAIRQSAQARAQEVTRG